MKTKRLISLLLAAVFALSAAATPALAASAGSELPDLTTAGVDENNSVVSIRLTADGDLTYGSPFTLSVQTTPADTQYIGVVMGTSGEAQGYVTLILSGKIRTLLKMIPLPKRMSATPDQTTDFNLYSYIKQLIDGNDVEVLLRVADEVASVMDALQFYIPTIKDVSTGLRLALEMIRKYLPAGSMSRIYVDEQPSDAGSYIAGAIALESGDLNTAGVAFFKIKPKTEGVRVYWAQEAPAAMTVEEARSFNAAAVVESDGQVVENGKVTYSYKKKSSFFGGTTISGFPTEPGTSLYIRPFIIATEPFLGVDVSETFQFYIILSPSGAYYESGLEPVGIWIEDDYVRAVRGGMGFAKTGGNYAASLRAGDRAEAKGYSQVLWLDGVHRKYIEEVGSMNVMFKVAGKILTPDLNGSVLSGITRRSCIQLLKDWGYEVEERRISAEELFQAAKDGTLEEAWGTGTAAVVSPIGELAEGDEKAIINHNEIGPVTQKLYDTLTGIQWGRVPDPHGWIMKL